jgi:hypothetical protein
MMIKIIAPPLGVVVDGEFKNLMDEVDPVAAGLTEADIKTLIDLGVLESGKTIATSKNLVAESTPTPEPLAPILPNLDIMNGSEAIALIHTIHDADQLAALLEQEIAHDNRKTVIAAIHKQQGI